MAYPNPLNALIHALRRLPGVGLRTAERYAFHLLEAPSQQQRDLCKAIETAERELHCCPTCGCLRDGSGCTFCTDTRRTARTICVIASMRDAFAIEETGTYRGLYHVLGGLLSPMDQLDAEELSIKSLLKRIQELNSEEVILALDATLEGDTTALYIREQLAPLPVKVSRLAFGLPLGSAFSYVDGGTLARAFTGRSLF